MSTGDINLPFEAWGMQDALPRLLRCVLKKQASQPVISDSFRPVPRRPLIDSLLGVAAIDQMLGPIVPGSLIGIASRPSIGKSLVLSQIARHVALTLRHSVVLFSPQDRVDTVLTRILAGEARVDLHRLRHGLLDDEGCESVLAAAARLADVPLVILDGRLDKPDTLTRLFDRISTNRPPPSLLLIDDAARSMGYDFRDPPSEFERDRLREALQRITQHHQTTVVCTLSLDRKAEKRAGHRPKLKDLSWLKELPYDFDAMMLLYRPDVYFPGAALSNSSRLQLEVFRGATPLGIVSSLRIAADIQTVSDDVL